MVVNLYLEKTYDRMEWLYIEETLSDVALPDKLILVIMNLTSSSSWQLLWNGEVATVIKQMRGLRQGDPLSLYIFVLCMGKMGQWNRSKVGNGV